VSPDELAARDRAENDRRNQPVQIPPDDLGNYIRQRWYSLRKPSISMIAVMERQTSQKRMWATSNQNNLDRWRQPHSDALV